MAQQQAIRFASNRNEFFTTLNKRVNEYFSKHEINRHANPEMVIKTIFMLSIYLIPYMLMITGIVSNIWAMAGLCAIMGVGIGGIGLSVMHDANHGAYSRTRWVNDFMGYALNLVGGNALNWKIQHNVLHHTFTNIHDVDEDISPRGILRMTPYSEWKSFHRFQFIYAWFAYGLMTIVWVFVKDFVRINKYHQDGLIKKQRTTIGKEWVILIATKVLYAAYIFVLPALILPLAWWQVFLGFFIMHYIAGFILAVIFQPAHVIDGTEYPLPDETGTMENNWAIHQMLTTTNFANENRLLSWYVGGLNFQIEHHLFPTVCHVHYRRIAGIVKQTAGEFGIPYKAQPTFRGALRSHARLLKELGMQPANAMVESRLQAG